MADNIIKAESAIQSSGNPKNPSEAVNPEAGMKKPGSMPKGKKKKRVVAKDMHGEMPMKEMISEGDFVMGMTSEGMIHGMVEHIMIEGGVYGVPGTEYAIQSMPPENPAMAVRIYEEEDGKWEPTAYSIGMMYKDAELIDINNHTMEEEDDMDSEVAMAMYDSSIGKSEEVEDEMEKAKKPNYGEMIQPRRGGSTPSNPKLYARVVQAAKDKFDVYPSAVANSWVVQEYKRRGGTYKSEKQIDTDNFWNGFIK